MNKKLGANTADATFLKIKRVSKIRLGGISTAIAYYQKEIFHLERREIKFRKPVLPSVITVKQIPLMTGPKSITGNISNPVIFGIGRPLNSLDATKQKAPVQESKNVKIK